MIDQSYLVLGLDALSHASGGDYFRDGHFGASVIAAYFLCRENGLDRRTQDTIKSIIDRDLRPTTAFRPAPVEEPDAGLIDQVLQTLSVGIADLRDVGHNVIFGAAALEAFHAVPASVTPYRTGGVCSLIASFQSTQQVALDANDGVPGLGDASGFSEFVCREFLQTGKRYAGRGHGWTGHLLTFGHALLTLSTLGYPDVATSGREAFRMYVQTVRGGPRESDPHVPEHQPSALTPLDRAYWGGRRSVQRGLGHAFKYARSFYSLVARLRDPALRMACLEESYRLF